MPAAPHWQRQGKSTRHLKLLMRSPGANRLLSDALRLLSLTASPWEPDRINTVVMCPELNQALSAVEPFIHYMILFSCCSPVE
jgi:hypothetical protein